MRVIGVVLQVLQNSLDTGCRDRGRVVRVRFPDQSYIVLIYAYLLSLHAVLWLAYAGCRILRYGEVAWNR